MLFKSEDIKEIPFKPAVTIHQRWAGQIEAALEVRKPIVRGKTELGLQGHNVGLRQCQGLWSNLLCGLTLSYVVSCGWFKKGHSFSLGVIDILFCYQWFPSPPISTTATNIYSVFTMCHELGSNFIFLFNHNIFFFFYVVGNYYFSHLTDEKPRLREDTSCETLEKKWQSSGLCQGSQSPKSMFLTSMLYCFPELRWLLESIHVRNSPLLNVPYIKIWNGFSPSSVILK